MQTWKNVAFWNWNCSIHYNELRGHIWRRRRRTDDHENDDGNGDVGGGFGLTLWFQSLSWCCRCPLPMASLQMFVCMSTFSLFILVSFPLFLFDQYELLSTLWWLPDYLCTMQINIENKLKIGPFVLLLYSLLVRLFFGGKWPHINTCFLPIRLDTAT